MTRYVALSTDANPHYAVYAPIVVRLWKRLGYEPILFTHDAGWGGPLAAFVSAQLPRTISQIDPWIARDVCCTRVEIPRIEPLSVGNTMRVSRLAAACLTELADTDSVMTADIDMAPLSRTWFDRDGSGCWALRADMYGSIEGASAKMHGESDQQALISGLFRLPLCYIGLPVEVWRTIMPYKLGDPVRSLRNINHGLRHDSHDHDEACTSARLLLSRWAAGPLQKVDDYWVQGSLHIVPMTDWPTGQPKRMLLGADAKRKPADAIDFHMPKPGAPAWLPEVLGHYWPEERGFLESYWREVIRLGGAS